MKGNYFAWLPTCIFIGHLVLFCLAYLPAAVLKLSSMPFARQSYRVQILRAFICLFF